MIFLYGFTSSLLNVPYQPVTPAVGKQKPDHLTKTEKATPTSHFKNLHAIFFLLD